jgi:hypothetical protein
MKKQSNCKTHGFHPTKANKLRDIIAQCPYSSRHLFLMSIFINLVVSILIEEEVTLIMGLLSTMINVKRMNELTSYSPHRWYTPPLHID